MLRERQLDLLEQRVHGVKIRKDSARRKVQDEVFDERTLMTIYDLINDKVVDTIEYPVSTGKEGNVFAATSSEGLRAVKIYRVTNANFQAMQAYIAGDPRFAGLVGNRKKLIFEWCRKEFRNLARYHQAGLNVPAPVAQRNNVLVMSYVGDESGPAPVLKFTPPRDLIQAKDWMGTLLDFIIRGRQEADLVHADLSEFNVLVWNDTPWVIDVGQGVVGSHPNAEEFLRRDVENVARFFRDLDLGFEGDLVDRTLKAALAPTPARSGGLR